MKNNSKTTVYEAPEMVQVALCVEQCLLTGSFSPKIDDWEAGDIYE